MELSKVKYVTAIPFAALALVMTLITGIAQIILVRNILTKLSADQMPTQYQALIQTTTPANALLLTPIVTCIVVYLTTIVMIFAYNQIAKKWPVTWEIKK